MENLHTPLPGLGRVKCMQPYLYRQSGCLCNLNPGLQVATEKPYYCTKAKPHEDIYMLSDILIA